jgi:hypothetical protein
VRNSGSADLSVSAIDCSDPAFSVQGDTAFQLAPGGSVALTIQFLPATAGQYSATLTIRSNSSNQPAVSVGLSGAGVGVPLIAVEPTRIDFATVLVGLTSQRALTVRSIGSTDLTVSALQPSDATFSVVGDTAFQLAPGAAKTLGARFSPTRPGAHEGSLAIHSNAADQPILAIPLAGIAARGPEIVVEPESLDFASVAIGHSAELPLTVRNPGDRPLLVTAVGADQPAFTVVGDTTFGLDPGTASVLTVRFTPSVEGRLQGSLSIICNDRVRPTLLVPLVGTGEYSPVEGPLILLEPRQLNFGAVPVGQTAQQNITVRNGGLALLTVSQVRITPAVYTVIGDTTFAVDPLAWRSVTVEYSPDREGSHGGSLTFVSNDPQQPEASVVLYGSGTRCFVATAAHGSHMQKEVRTLRSWRDDSLVHSPRGRHLIRLYYRWNNRATALIAHSRVGRSAARAALRPLVILSRLTAARKREKAVDGKHPQPSAQSREGDPFQS